MQWMLTPELRLVKTWSDNDHKFIHTLHQKWIKEGFKDGEVYTIESEWRPIPEVERKAT